MASHLFTTGNLRLTDDQGEWEKVAGRMGVTTARLRLIRQVHGVAVAIARAGEAGPDVRPEADVIISDDPDVAIGVRVADCAPVLVADRRTGAVGAAHAGWRGTAAQAAVVAVAAMTSTFGSNPRDLVAAIGPCLGPCCGEVGPEVVESFREGGHREADLARWFTEGVFGRALLDLWTANRDQLERAGVPGGHIHVAAICTKSHASSLHSHRAHGREAGRMAGLIRARRAP
ncbi:peptidoglycan editing factor PgeF [soil metagenome]